MKKWGIWIVGLLIVGGILGGFFWWRGQQNQDQTQDILRSAQVSRETLDITVPASGNIAVNQKLELTFNSSGTVETVSVSLNERVTAGQTLAKLESADLERAVRQSEIALEQAKLTLNTLTKPADNQDLELAQLAVQSAGQALEAARLGRESARVDADSIVVQAQRARENSFKQYREAEGSNREEGLLSVYENYEEQESIAEINAELTKKQAQDQWLSAYSNYQQALNNLQTLENGPKETQIRQIQLQIEQAQLNLEQATNRLTDSDLTAPLDGTIAAIHIQPGGQSSGASPAFTLIDDAVFYVAVTIDEIEIGKVNVGQFTEITLDAYPNIMLEGEIEIVEPAAVNLGGIISYQVRVRVTETNEAEVRDGMTASIVIHTSKIEDALLIPNWAIRTDQDSRETYAYVLNAAGIPERTMVTLGARNDNSTEVLDGLDEDVTVVLISESTLPFDFAQ